MEYGGEGSETSQSNATSLITNVETDVSVVPAGSRTSCDSVGGLSQQERLRFHERTGSLVSKTFFFFYCS